MTAHTKINVLHPRDVGLLLGLMFCRWFLESNTAPLDAIGIPTSTSSPIVHPAPFIILIKLFPQLGLAYISDTLKDMQNPDFLSENG
jgi:hypothetical protein